MILIISIENTKSKKEKTKIYNLTIHRYHGVVAISILLSTLPL